MVFKKKRSSMEKLLLGFDLLSFPLAFLRSFLFISKTYFKAKCSLLGILVQPGEERCAVFRKQSPAALTEGPRVCSAITATGIGAPQQQELHKYIKPAQPQRHHFKHKQPQPSSRSTFASCEMGTRAIAAALKSGWETSQKDVQNILRMCST